MADLLALLLADGPVLPLLLRERSEESFDENLEESFEIGHWTSVLIAGAHAHI